jgi:hypothetical protein
LCQGKLWSKENFGYPYPSAKNLPNFEKNQIFQAKINKIKHLAIMQ